MTIKCVEWDDYVKQVREMDYLNNGNWNNYKQRWQYHDVAIQIIKGMGLTSSKQVLELGSLGVQLVKGSDTMDYANKRWNGESFSPTILHDVRHIPWPIQTNSYQLFIALRVFQHLPDCQKEAFREALRISQKVLIVVPTKYGRGKGLSVEEMMKWNTGTSIKLKHYVAFRDNKNELSVWSKQ